MAGGQRVFRRLVRILFPAEFHAEYGAEMAQTFKAQHEEARHEGVPGLVRLWFETLVGLLSTAPRQHVDQLRLDLRYAARTMARRPVVHAVAGLVLAVGIASTTVIASIVDAALLRPVPFGDPDRLVAVRERTPQDARLWELSYPTYLELRHGATSFRQLAAYMREQVVVGGEEPQLADAASISANLIETLGVRPIAGRGFTDAADTPPGEPAVVISERFARMRFGSPGQAVGRPLRIDDRPATVVGVLPDRFRFPDADVDVWLPIGRVADQPWMRNRAVHVAQVVGRVRDEVSLDVVDAELRAWMDGLHAREPAADPGHQLLARSFARQMSAPARGAVTALAGAVLLLLVVTCASVGLLLLTRVAARRREIAVRLALGATRARLARQLLTEGLCLAAVGTVVGVAGAHALLGSVVRGLEDVLPPFVTPSINGAALGAAAVIGAATTVLCGTAPAAALAYARHAAPRADRSRRRLVGTQVAVTGALVVLALLLGRSLDRVFQVDVGFDAERLLMVRVTAPAARERAGGLERFFEGVTERVGALPGVAAVTAGSVPPLRAAGHGDLTVEGAVPEVAAPLATFRRVQPGHFTALGIPLIAGRDFTPRDGSGEPVVIVSASLARRFWTVDEAIGRRIKVGPADQEPWLRVVGVVGDVRNEALEAGFDLATYEPHAQRPGNGMFVLLRTDGDAAAFTSTVQRAVREIEPQVVLSETSTMERRISESMATRRFYTVVVTTFAGATLLLVALSLYGALASSVASRAREMAVRATVGASSARLMRDVLADGLRPTLAGLAVGLAGGALVASASRSLLFGVTPADGWAYAGTAALLLCVAVVSCWIPARSASRIDPSSALRAE